MRHDRIREDIEAANVPELIRAGLDGEILNALVDTVEGYAERYEGEPDVADVTTALADWPMVVRYFANDGTEVTASDAWGYKQETRA